MGLKMSLAASNASLIPFDVLFGKEAHRPELAELASTYTDIEPQRCRPRMSVITSGRPRHMSKSRLSSPTPFKPCR